jgi:hypothetical protein
MAHEIEKLFQAIWGFIILVIFAFLVLPELGRATGQSDFLSFISRLLLILGAIAIVIGFWEAIRRWA